MTAERLTAFSDGVLAIIITIMALELKVPHSAEWEALRETVPVFLAYALSFTYIAIYWNNHHHMFQTVRRVIFPALLPPLLTGFALAFARAVGEYGSIIFIAGNLPYKSEIAPLLIIIRLEEFNYGGATAIATIMLLLSFTVILAVNLLQSWSRRRTGYAS